MQNPRGNVSIIKHINLLSISEGVELHSVRLAKFRVGTIFQEYNRSKVSTKNKTKTKNLIYKSIPECL